MPRHPPRFRLSECLPALHTLVVTSSWLEEGNLTTLLAHIGNTLRIVVFSRVIVLCHRGEQVGWYDPLHFILKAVLSSSGACPSTLSALEHISIGQPAVPPPLPLSVRPPKLDYLQRLACITKLDIHSGLLEDTFGLPPLVSALTVLFKPSHCETRRTLLTQIASLARHLPLWKLQASGLQILRLRVPECPTGQVLTWRLICLLLPTHSCTRGLLLATDLW